MAGQFLCGLDLTKGEISPWFGELIVSAEIIDNELMLRFDSGKAIKLYDGGQSCCEDRHMTTDDEPFTLQGAKLVSIEAKEMPDVVGKWGQVHETMCVEVRTNKGFITLVTHNEHGGYYSGFSLKITEV